MNGSIVHDDCAQSSQFVAGLWSTIIITSEDVWPVESGHLQQSKHCRGRPRSLLLDNFLLFPLCFNPTRARVRKPCSGSAFGMIIIIIVVRWQLTSRTTSETTSLPNLCVSITGSLPSTESSSPELTKLNWTQYISKQSASQSELANWLVGWSVSSQVSSWNRTKSFCIQPIARVVLPLCTASAKAENKQ